MNLCYEIVKTDSTPFFGKTSEETGFLGDILEL